ncbi:MAG TPA: GntR family transcriptional regulator [Pyrinomonadaceae bacterium]|jgi:DNA-binding transcriptional regulator YhcF (GntR family)
MQLEIQLKPLTEGPVYMQVRDQIEARIRDRLLSSGDPLPAPAVLAQKLSVDKGEIQRAYFELEQSGRLKKSVSRDFLGKERAVYTVV